MVELITLTLENEMDLVLAQKKASKLSEVLKLSLSTQATFATSIAEICRVVIDFTDSGVLSLGLVKHSQRYSLAGVIKYQAVDGNIIPEESYFYARKLVPSFEITIQAGVVVIEVGINLPKSINLDVNKVKLLKDVFEKEPSMSAYEEIKKKNLELFHIAEDKDAQLRQSKYIDDKRNEFISIASHELKTPITIIKAYTQMALSGKADCSDLVKDFLLKIDAQSTKLRNLVQQLLDTSKIENGKLEYNFVEVNFNEFIHDTSFLINHINPRHKIEISLSENVRVRIDKDRMDQVFTNLISNAGKYSKEGSVISLKTTIDPKGELIVSIIDRGIGMSGASLEKIFHKFHRDKQVINGYSGLGMGLYIAAEIVNDHGGRIWVESTINKGSAFSFCLPILK